MVKYVRQKALPEADIITEGDPVMIPKICKRPLITYFCNQLSLALPGESVVSVDSMADAMKMLLVLHWICNILYCDSTKCIFKMIERLGNIKGKDKFTLSMRSQQVVAEVSNTPIILFLI